MGKKDDKGLSGFAKTEIVLGTIGALLIIGLIIEEKAF